MEKKYKTLKEAKEDGWLLVPCAFPTKYAYYAKGNLQLREDELLDIQENLESVKEDLNKICEQLGKLSIKKGSLEDKLLSMTNNSWKEIAPYNGIKAIRIIAKENKITLLDAKHILDNFLNPDKK